MRAMQEIWADIPGYEGEYQASTLGNIRSVDRLIEYKKSSGNTVYRYMKGISLSPFIYSRSGHLAVRLSGKNRRISYIHQLVALTFIGERPAGKVVCHNDGDPKNNSISNLRYDSQTENNRDIYRHGRKCGIGKLNIDDVLRIKERLNKGETPKEIAKDYSVLDSEIRQIRNGRRFSWVNEFCP